MRLQAVNHNLCWVAYSEPEEPSVGGTGQTAFCYNYRPQALPVLRSACVPGDCRPGERTALQMWLMWPLWLNTLSLKPLPPQGRCVHVCLHVCVQKYIWVQRYLHTWICVFACVYKCCTELLGTHNLGLYPRSVPS